LSEICIKTRYFYGEIAKIAHRWELRPQTLLPSDPASGGRGLRPHTPIIPVTNPIKKSWLHHWLQ